MSTLMATPAAQRVQDILDLWSRLAMRHVALGAGCGCGVGGVALRLDDFELDIADYLQDAGTRAEEAEVAAFFRALPHPGTRSAPLRALLEDVQEESVPPQVADWLLPRVETTLRSFSKAHGGR